MFQEIAHAKINLYLHVTGKRDDGYHLLDSLVVFTQMGDVLNYYPSDEPFTLSVRGPFSETLKASSTSGDNLVIRAAKSFYEAHKGEHVKQGHFVLEKNLPVASGIGGGSADAAAVLRLLHRCWGADVSSELMLELAYQLGADVPVCYLSKPAQMQGIGEKLTPIKHFPHCGIVLVNCMEAISTPAIFKARNGAFLPAISIEKGWQDYRTLLTFLDKQGNSLQEAAQSLCPPIASSLDAIAQQKDCSLARMSGSGATCFGLFETKEKAEHAAQNIARQHPQWWCWGGDVCTA